eukprot:1159976-Pelagomonas_calceolata.AAC.8
MKPKPAKGKTRRSKFWQGVRSGKLCMAANKSAGDNVQISRGALLTQCGRSGGHRRHYMVQQAHC